MLAMVVRLRFYQQTGDAVMPLTDTKVKNAKPLDKEYKLTDGFGMFLRITPKGSKYWQMAYRFEGKQKSSPSVSTLLFHLQMQDNAVMKLKDFLLKALILTPRNRPKLKSLKQSVITPEHSKP